MTHNPPTAVNPELAEARERLLPLFGPGAYSFGVCEEGILFVVHWDHGAKHEFRGDVVEIEQQLAETALVGKCSRCQEIVRRGYEWCDSCNPYFCAECGRKDGTHDCECERFDVHELRSMGR